MSRPRRACTACGVGCCHCFCPKHVNSCCTSVIMLHCKRTLDKAYSFCICLRSLMNGCTGGRYVPFCVWIQHVKLAVIGIGYTITAGIAMV